MQWRQIYIRKDILTRGVIHNEPIRFSAPNNSIISTLPASIQQLLSLPRSIPEVPHNPPTSIFEHIRERLSQSQILVYHLGEPIETFMGRKLVELPTPLLGTRTIDINYFTLVHHQVSVLFITYGRRLFVAARPVSGDHEQGFILRTGRVSRLPLPQVFDTSLSSHVVEDHRAGDRYLDPTVMLGLSPRLSDPILEAVQPQWNGFLKMQSNNFSLLTRASAITIALPRQPTITGIESLPTWIKLGKENVITAKEAMERISVPGAEWLGVIVMKDDMGLQARSYRIDEVHNLMIAEGIAYRYKMNRGMLYMWSMHIGRSQLGSNNLVFAIVPTNEETTIQTISLRRTGSIRWRGMLSIAGMNIRVVAVRLEAPGRLMMMEYGWGDRLNFMTSFEVRRVLPTLIRYGRWGMRFIAEDGDDFVNNMQVLTLGFSLMELGKAYRMRIGEGGEMGDLVLFSTNHHGLGVCLVGVHMDYGELGI